jgi:hypothetical protein
MGSPLSSTLAEIHLQYFEELMITHWMETGEITYYRTHVCDICPKSALVGLLQIYFENARYED